MSQLRVQVSTNWHEFSASRTEWGDLLNCCRDVTVFQTYEWYAAWWKAFGQNHRLMLLSARDGKRLVGIAPLMTTRTPSRRTRIVFIGGEHADYQDFLIATDTSAPVLELFLSQLLRSPVPWATLELRNLPSTSIHLNALDHTAQTNMLYSLSRRTRCPTLLIQDHEDAARAILSKYSMRRPLNYFKRFGEIRWRVFTDVTEAVKYLPLFAAQHIQRWKGTKNPSKLQNPAYLHFYEELIRSFLPRGWLSFSVVELNGEPIAFHFGFLYRGRLVWYKPSFSMSHAKHSPGMVLLRFLIEYALNDGITELDFTIGDEPFKRRFANAERENLDFLFFQGRVPYLGAKLHRELRAAARRLVNRALALRTATSSMVSREYP